MSGDQQPTSQQAHQPARTTISDLVATRRRVRVAWEHRWYEEQVFANRLSFYMLAQSFLVIGAVTATVSSVSIGRWFPVSMAIDATGLLLTLIFWYVLTENFRMLTLLKDFTETKPMKLGVADYEDLRQIRDEHLDLRRKRHLPLLPKASPSAWLASGISILFGVMWAALAGVAIALAV